MMEDECHRLRPVLPCRRIGRRSPVSERRVVVNRQSLSGGECARRSCWQLSAGAVANGCVVAANPRRDANRPGPVSDEGFAITWPDDLNAKEVAFDQDVLGTEWLEDDAALRHLKTLDY
jgi:hypothetical protein